MTVSAWVYLPPDAPLLVLGEHNHPDGHDGALVHVARSLEVAQGWARELRAGRLPSSAEETDSTAS